MIKNFNNLSTKIYEVIKSDGAAAMKITFKNLSASSDFVNNYLCTVLSPLWYHYSKHVVVITQTDYYGEDTTTTTLADILSVAAQDYDAKKIQSI
jgi:hypothetical protein